MGVDIAQTATATSHTDWLDINLVDVKVQKGLTTLFSSDRAQKAGLETAKKLKAQEKIMACRRYFKQGEPRNVDHQANLIQICQI